MKGSREINDLRELFFGREACNLRTKERLRFEAEFAVQMATEIAAKLFELSGVVFIKVAWRLVIHKTAEIFGAPERGGIVVERFEGRHVFIPNGIGFFARSARKPVT